MSTSMRMGLHGSMSVLSIFVLACSDTATAPVSRNAPTNLGVANLAAANLTGRIAYTTGTLHIYNLATATDVSLGIAGVNPKFSPDGTRITYQNRGIYVMNADGTNGRVLSTSGGTPSFDPTGTIIAFNNSGVWKINVDGTGLARLTADGGRQPAWSPDGTQIAYNASVGSAQQLFIMNADGTNRHQVVTSGSVIDVVWQPSAKILFGISNGNYDLFSYDPASPTSLTRLTTSTATDFEPSWSPDGTQISWTSGTSGKTSGIWIMNADGTGKLGPVIPNGRQGSWGR